jgi:HSP20 family protein
MAQHDRKDEGRQRASGTTTGRALQSRREGGRGEIAWRDPFSGIWGSDPFSTMRRFSEQMDRWFGEMGFDRDSGAWRGVSAGRPSFWSPQVEANQRGDRFIVRVDLPGLKKDDVNIEVADNMLTIQGERRDEHEEDREGYYRSECRYGSFARVIPLPEGSIAETAKASFKDGVLEITVQAPPREVSRGRRVEISEPSLSGPPRQSER